MRSFSVLLLLLACCGGTVLRQGRGGFEDQVRFGNQVLQGFKRTPVDGHTSTVRRDRGERKTAEFFVNAHFRHYPARKRGTVRKCD
jgi:hypothetical protein